MNLNFCPDRAWKLQQHLRHLSEENWVPMYDDHGNVLAGIEGMPGVRDQKPDGTFIGADFVRMQPGASFPLHTHQGDHEIYFISGFGFVTINEDAIAVRAGSLIHIPAEYPHAVWVPDRGIEPLIFCAMGHPHQHVDAHDRMQKPSYTQRLSNL
jgi:mannose-6-phosphate isomerase-like protein (cupin superfamily)